MAIVTDLSTLKTTFAGPTDWAVMETHAHELARHYRKLGKSWNTAQRDAWAEVKKCSCEVDGVNVPCPISFPAFVFRNF